MNISDFRVEPADYKADFDDLLAIREAVFVVEQNIPKEFVFDAIDPGCYHFIARDNQHRAIGAARLSPNRKIEFVAVLPNWRRQGIGKALVTALLEKARKLGFLEVTVNAQVEVSAFYEKSGFTLEEDIFTETNIPHQSMHLALSPIQKSGRSVPKPRTATVEMTEIGTFEDLLNASFYLTMKARKQIRIFTPDLESALYGHKNLLEALKAFAIGSKGGNIMIIVQETLTVRSQSHPLIDLAQRLPSVFLFRTPVEVEDLQYSSAYLLNDREGYLFRLQNDKTAGNWSPALPARNRQLLEEFERIWQRSRPCTEFRALGI